MGRPRKNPDSTILVAVESGAAEVNGEVLQFTKGVTRVRAGHPLAAASPASFEPIEVHYDWERAVDEPGVSRGGGEAA